MYARLDDELIDHRKIFAAGDLLGRNGAAIALGMYAVGLMYANRHLTDGVIPLSVLRTFRHVSRPLRVADALVRSGLWEKNGSGSLRWNLGGSYVLPAFRTSRFARRFCA
jgi:hypothetical protein